METSDSSFLRSCGSRDVPFVAQAARTEQVYVPGCRGGSHPTDTPEESITALQSRAQQVGKEAGGELGLRQHLASLCTQLTKWERQSTSLALAIFAR